MRIASFYHFSNVQDEGVRIVGKSLTQRLSEYAEVRSFPLPGLSELREVRKFKPDVCQFTISFSSFLSVAIPKVISSLTSNRVLSILAVQPSLSPALKFALRLSKPDLVIVQSNQSSKYFQEAGVDSRLISHGVDVTRYHRDQSSKREHARIDWGLPTDKKIVLHVGSIRSNRNVEMLSQLTAPDRQVVVVGRESTQQDKKLGHRLRESGCIVWDRYFLNIEEIYRIADVFVFPCTDPRGAIDLPLSVLEAVASGCPVVATKFRGIPDWQREMNLTDGLTIVDAPSEIPSEVARILNGKEQVTSDLTRARLRSWDEMARRIVAEYSKLL